MNKLHLPAMVTGLGLLLTAGSPAWAGPVCVPPGCNPTTSDGNGNTAGGTTALSDNTTGIFNTAFVG